MSIARAARVPGLGWLIGEGRALARALGSPALYLVALATVLAVTATYQVRPSYHISVGGPTDRPYLETIHAAEVDGNAARSDDPVVRRYAAWRWTQPDSVVKLPGIGRQDVTVHLELSGARPPGAPPPGPVQVFSKGTGDPADRFGPGRLVATLDPVPEPKTYTFALARDPDLTSGDLRLTIRTTTPFTPTGDPRVLGVRLFNVDVVPADTPSKGIIPPVSQITPLLVSALLAALLALRLGWGVGGAALAGLGWALAAAAFLLWDRPWLTVITGILPPLLAGTYVLVIVLGPLVAWLYRWGGIGWPGGERRVLLTVFAAAFAARLGGQLHPEIYIPDLGFHANRFSEVLNGNLLFTIYSAEWGNHKTFYLPTVYMFMAPFQALLNDRFLTVRVFTVLLDTTSVFLLYYLARRALGSGRAGLWAAMLFVTFPQAVLVFSWGITANVFAQWTTLAVATVVVVGYERLNRPLVWGLLVAVLFLALMSHPGTVQLTAVMMAITLALWAWLRGRVGPARSWWLVGGALVAAAVIAFLVYYINWVGLELSEFAAIQEERRKLAGGVFRVRVGGSVNDISLDLYSYFVYSRQAQILEGLWGFWKEAWAYYKTWPLLWAVCGLLAAGPLTPVLRRLRTLSVGWVAAMVVFAVVGLISNLYVRYPLFILPLVALGGGALLEWLRRRGQAGALLLPLVLGTFIVNALALWWWRIMFYLK